MKIFRKFRRFKKFNFFKKKNTKIEKKFLIRFQKLNLYLSILNFYESKLINKLNKFIIYRSAHFLSIMSRTRYYNITSYTIKMKKLKPKKIKSFNEIMVFKKNLFRKIITQSKRTNHKTIFGKLMIERFKMQQYFSMTRKELIKIWNKKNKKKVKNTYNFMRNIQMFPESIIFRLGLGQSLKHSRKLLEMNMIVINNKIIHKKNKSCKANDIIKINSLCSKLYIYKLIYKNYQNFQIFTKPGNKNFELNTSALSFIVLKKFKTFYVAGNFRTLYSNVLDNLNLKILPITSKSKTRKPSDKKLFGKP